MSRTSWQDARILGELLMVRTDERDRAREVAVALEQENAELRLQVERLECQVVDQDDDLPVSEADLDDMRRALRQAWHRGFMRGRRST